MCVCLVYPCRTIKLTISEELPEITPIIIGGIPCSAEPFTIEPMLPKGLEFSPYTAGIRGVAQEVADTEFTVTGHLQVHSSSQPVTVTTKIAIHVKEAQ